MARIRIVASLLAAIAFNDLALADGASTSYLRIGNEFSAKRNRSSSSLRRRRRRPYPLTRSLCGHDKIGSWQQERVFRLV